MVRVTKSGDAFVEKKVSLREALHEINDQIIDNSVRKIMHPIGLLVFILSGKSWLPSLSNRSRVCRDNC